MLRLAALAAVLLGSLLPAACAGDPEAAPAAAAPVVRGAVEDCSTQSWADFTGAFSDPGNVVLGPFVLVGGAEPTTAEVVESVGGNKYALLVRDGHVATVEVPQEARAHASLGYGPLPQGEVRGRDGHPTVTFVACDGSSPSGSTGDMPVTFWAGFLLADEPQCLPLDVWTDGAGAPRRIEVELGAPC